MAKPALLAVPALIAFCLAQGHAARPAFEIASVKPSSNPDFRGGKLHFPPGGKLTIRNIPLLMIVAVAYNIPFQSPRLIGGPEWQKLATSRFDIDASSPAPAARQDQLRLMLQSLLEDRFKLHMRTEQKDQPIYAVVISPGGPKLQKSKLQETDCIEFAACHNPGGGQGRGIHGDAINIADIALWVQNWTDRPVVDKTGLSDLYKIDGRRLDAYAPAPLAPMARPEATQAFLDPDRKTRSLPLLPGTRPETRIAAGSCRHVHHRPCRTARRQLRPPYNRQISNSRS